MANFLKILLAGALGLGAYFLSRNKKEYKAADGTVFSSEKEKEAYEAAVAAKTVAEKEASTAKDDKDNYKAVEEAKKYLDTVDKSLSNKVIISDATIQMFDNKNNTLLQIAHVYVWVKLKNISDIPLLVTFTDVVATIVHTSNGKAFSFERDSIIIPAYTETKWIRLTSNYSSIFPKAELVSDIKNYFPVKSNFFLPAHLVLKYDVSIPNQDSILSKDVIYENNVECYYINYNDKSPLVEQLPEKDLINGYYYKMISFSPDDQPKYQAYLDILRDSKSPIKSTQWSAAPVSSAYVGKPIRYIFKANNEDGIKRSTRYRKFKYYGHKGVLGVWEQQKEPIYLPYMGIVYNEKGVVAYE